MIIEVKWEREKEILIARLFGRIDSSTATDLLERIENGVGDSDRRLILDFEKVSYIASAGLRVCLVIARRFAEPDRDFAICALGPFARTVVSASGFDKLISLHESRAEAMRSMTADPAARAGHTPS